MNEVFRKGTPLGQGRKSMYKHGGRNIHPALLGWFGGMLPPRKFFKWCNLVRSGIYLDQILSLKNFKKILKIIIFYIKGKHFRYTLAIE